VLYETTSGLLVCFDLNMAASEGILLQNQDSFGGV